MSTSSRLAASLMLKSQEVEPCFDEAAQKYTPPTSNLKSKLIRREDRAGKAFVRSNDILTSVKKSLLMEK